MSEYVPFCEAVWGVQVSGWVLSDTISLVKVARLADVTETSSVPKSGETTVTVVEVP